MKVGAIAIYLIAEIAAFIGLVFAIGFWWTLLIAFLATVIGVILLRRQGARVFGELREAAATTAAAPARPLADVALLALATFLLFVPGIVSTAVGIALLLPPVRVVTRPLVVALGARRLVVAMDKMSAAPRSVTVIDGEVVDTGDRRSRRPGSPGGRSLP